MEQYGIQSQGRLNVHNHSNILLGGNVPIGSITGHSKGLHDALALAHGSLSELDLDHHLLYFLFADHTKAIHDALGILHSSLGGKTVNDHHAQAHNLDTHAIRLHANLQTIGEGDHHAKNQPHSGTTGRTANDHHAQAHSLASHSSKAHNELTGVTSAQHHALPTSAELAFGIACRVWRNGNQDIPSGAPTKVLFNAENYDLGSNFDADGADSNFTVPSAGYYLVQSILQMMALSASTTIQTHVYKNGVAIAVGSRKTGGGGGRK